MVVIKKIDLSKPLENFADERGKQLFEWAEQTWRGFLEQILQLMEGDDISDHDFIMICNKLARVHSARHPDKHAEMLTDWSDLVGFPPTDIKTWEAGKSLPAIAEREAVVRQMLQGLVKYISNVNMEAFLATIVHLVNLQDLREPGTFVVVSPNTRRRSIHRLGLTKEVSEALFKSNIKTLGDLQSFIEPPGQGGLITRSRRHANPNPRLTFNPKEKLQRLKGIDDGVAAQILETAGQWSGMWSPSVLLV